MAKPVFILFLMKIKANMANGLIQRDYCIPSELLAACSVSHNDISSSTTDSNRRYYRHVYTTAQPMFPLDKFDFFFLSTVEEL